ncbi:MAG: hypothetical protein ACFFAH_16785 [Promethearchaeota archaeon]
MKDEDINKKDQKSVLYIIITLVITLFIFNFIHEFGHIIGILLLNARLYSMSIGFTIFGPSLQLKVGYNYTMQIIIIAISGSLFSCLIAIIISYFSRKKENYSLGLSSLCVIFNEFIYWCLAYVFKFGDAFVLYSYSSFVFVLIIISFIGILLMISLRNFIVINRLSFNS